MACQQESSLSDHLRVRVNLDQSCTLGFLNVSLGAAVQSEPEGHDLHLFVELHDVDIICGVCIRVRWQVEHFILLSDVIDSYLVRRSLLAEHDLAREGDNKLDCRRVNLTERAGDRVIVVRGDLIVHEKFEDERVLLLKHLDSNYEAVFVIRLFQSCRLICLSERLRLKPELAKFVRAAHGTRRVLIE